jgi:hypothetical protein
MVRKTIASAVRRRRVATSVPASTTRSSSSGAVSQQRDVTPLGHAIEPVQHLVHDVGERLDQRDPGIGDVVIGPLRAAPLDESFAVVDEVLEPPVVEVGRSERHGHSSDGIT